VAVQACLPREILHPVECTHVVHVLHSEGRYRWVCVLTMAMAMATLSMLHRPASPDWQLKASLLFCSGS
jgi:hypothetical protein